MINKPRIFISYARTDGEVFAQTLRQRLIQNFGAEAIWRDRDAMEGGRDWWQQITEALDQVEFMVLVATPRALASPVVTKEWRYARQQGVCVYPVQVPEQPLNFNALPKWMRNSHFYNLDNEWETFVNYLNNPCEALKIPFMAPDLPKNYVKRPQVYQQLKQQLLEPDQLNPVAITTSLQGAGGFGKTTLATALCHDEAIQTAYDDGILWVTLGENPNVLDALTKLYQTLSEKPANFIDIDDVWQSAHLAPFLRGGKRCTRLITTRDRGISLRAKAENTEVDTMTLTESTQLLSQGIAGLSNASLRALAERLGEWPLMLELANAMLLERIQIIKDTPENALKWLNQVLQKRGVIGINQENTEERKSGTAGVLNSSFELLSPKEVTALEELAIFFEDTEIPTASIMALWGMDELDTEEKLIKFTRLSFLRYQSSTRTMRIHDVIREYLATRIANLVQVHQKLMTGWDDPLHLPDVYAWRFYAYHLTQAEQPEQLRTLLLNPAWLQAKLNATDANALIADCDLLPSDPILQLLRSALRMSQHVLAVDKTQLFSQLYNRLYRHQDKPEIKVFREQMEAFLYLLPLENNYDVLNPAGGAELAVLAGHEGAVKGAVELGDGRLLSWSWDNTLRLWSAGGETIAVLAGHEHWVLGAVELDDGRLLSWSDDHTLRLWSAGGEVLAVLAGHGHKVTGAVELGDGRLLSWSDDNTLRLWSAGGEALAVLAGHGEWVLGAIELDDGRLLSWSYDNTLRLWSAGGEALAVLAGHQERILGAVELKDGRLLSWSSDNTLRLWSAGGEVLAVLAGHGRSVLGAVELGDGRLLSWSSDNTLRLWSAGGEALAVLAGHSHKVTGAVELGDGRLLSWSDDKTLRLWSAGGEVLAVLAGHGGSVLGAVELGDGRLLSWSSDNTLRLWRAGGGETLAVLAGHGEWVLGAVELGDGRLLSWSEDNTLRLWRAGGEALAVLAGHGGSVLGTVELKDGRLLSWSRDNTLRLWRAGGEPLAMLDESIWGSREKIFTWANTQGFDANMIFDQTNEPTLKSYRVRRDDNQLFVYERKNGQLVANFYGDANLSTHPVVTQNNIIVVGDQAGRVLFFKLQNVKGTSPR